MDWLEFFANVIQAIAWPVAVVIIVLVLGPRVLRSDALSGVVKHLKIGATGVEVEWWERQLDEARLDMRRGRAQLTGGSASASGASGDLNVSSASDVTIRPDSVEHKHTVTEPVVEAKSSHVLQAAYLEALDLARVNPFLAIEWAWESITQELGNAVGIDDVMEGDALALAYRAVVLGRLSRDEASAYDRLRRLHHTTLTDPSSYLSEEFALDFIAVAEELSVAIHSRRSHAPEQ